MLLGNSFRFLFQRRRRLFPILTITVCYGSGRTLFFDPSHSSLFASSIYRPLRGLVPTLVRFRQIGLGHLVRDSLLVVGPEFRLSLFLVWPRRFFFPLQSVGRRGGKAGIACRAIFCFSGLCVSTAGPPCCIRGIDVPYGWNSRCRVICPLRSGHQSFGPRLRVADRSYFAGGGALWAGIKARE